VSPESRQGLRRDRRCRYKPLGWWCLEKVIYGTDHDEGRGNDKEERHEKPVTLVPPIKVILRVLREPTEGRRGKSVTSDPGSVSFSEAGWDKDTAAFSRHLVDYAIKGKKNRVYGVNVSRNTQRGQIIRTRRFLAREGRSLLDTPIWNLGRRNRTRARGTIRMCVLSFVYWGLVKPLTVGGWIFNGVQGVIRSIPPVSRFVKESMS